MDLGTEISAEQSGVVVCLLIYSRWLLLRFGDASAVSADSRRVRRYAWLLVVVVFVMGLLAKQSIVTLPCVFVLLDYWQWSRQRKHQAERLDAQLASPAFATMLLQYLPGKLVMLLLVAGFSYLVLRAQQGALAQTTAMPVWVRMGNAVNAYAAYLDNGLGLADWPRSIHMLARSYR